RRPAPPPCRPRGAHEPAGCGAVARRIICPLVEPLWGRGSPNRRETMTTNPATIRRWSMSRSARRPTWVFVSLALGAGLLWLGTGGPAGGEPCLSPFVKRLDRPEKYLYVFCVDADAKDNDFLIVIDVDRKSPQYGKITYRLDLGSAGNETHHFGFTDDRTH